MKRILYIILAAAVVLTGNYLFSNSTLDVKVETSVPTVVIQTLPPAQTQTPVLPSVTNVPASGQALEGPNINFNGVRFTLDPTFGSRVYVLDNWIMSRMDGKTAHSLHFYLRDQDYISCSQMNSQWCIQIYRVADFEKAFGTFVFPPSIPGGSGSAIIFEAQKKAISFQNGSGDRALETYSQGGLYPVANELLTYAFRGYSADKQYAVYVGIPIHAAGLPDVVPTRVPGADPFPDLQNNFQKALQTVNALAPADFTPNLDLLDALVASISVEAPQ